MKLCAYCEKELDLASGMYDSSEDSPEVEFWHCKTCEHTHMDEDQEKELMVNLALKKPLHCTRNKE